MSGNRNTTSVKALSSQLLSPRAGAMEHAEVPVKTTSRRSASASKAGSGSKVAVQHALRVSTSRRAAPKKGTRARKGTVRKRAARKGTSGKGVAGKRAADKRHRARRRIWRQQPGDSIMEQRLELLPEQLQQPELLQQMNDGQPKEYYHGNVYTAGYEHGLYEGGEQLLEQAMPSHLLLPEISLREVIALGVEQLRPQFRPLLDVHEVFTEMEAAISERRPCAVVRLGDGELLTLAQEVVYDAATIQREGGFLPYAGVNPPDLKARDQLVQAVQQANIVGVPLSRRKHFQPLLFPVLRGHQLSLSSLRVTHSAINYSLHQAGLLKGLLAGKQLLVIGNMAPALANILHQRGFVVSGTVSPVRGLDDIERVMNEVRGIDFNLAIISAGIPAVILCTRIAQELGKTALDFGHMADGIVKGKFAL